MNRKKIVSLAAGGTAALIFILMIIFYALQDTTLEFRVVDKVSGSWVYNSTVRMAGRVNRGFKETDFRFTGLKPGSYRMTLEAPGYTSTSLEVELKKGRNRLEEPVALTGLTIGEIRNFYVKESYKNDSIFFEFRFAGPGGQAIANHPCLAAVFIGQIYEQSGGRLVDREMMNLEKYKGERIFAGPIPWEWDVKPPTTYRYIGRLDPVTLGVKKDQHYITEYLVLLPVPGAITQEEMEKAQRKIGVSQDQEELAAYLEGMKDKLQYFYTINGNVSLEEAGL